MAVDQQGMEDAGDDALVALFAKGEPTAARELAARHGPRILSVARRTLGDRAEAEDVTQEVMMRLWQKAGSWRPGGAKLSTWLFRVTVNLATDRLRRRRGVALDDAGDGTGDLVDPAPGRDAALIARERKDALDGALASLPERQRLAVVLRHVEGLGNPEIAEIMGVTTEAVESLTARGKRAMATALEPRRDELGLSA